MTARPKRRRERQLIRQMVDSKGLVQGTEEGYRNLEAGKVTALAEVKRRLRNV